MKVRKNESIPNRSVGKYVAETFDNNYAKFSNNAINEVSKTLAIETSKVSNEFTAMLTDHKTQIMSNSKVLLSYFRESNIWTKPICTQN